MTRPGYFVSTPTALTYYATRREAVLAASLVPEASVIREAENKPGVPAGKRDERATAEADRIRRLFCTECHEMRPCCCRYERARMRTAP